MNEALLHAPSGDAHVRVLVAPNSKRTPSTLDRHDIEPIPEDPHDHSWDENMVNPNVKPKYDFVDASYAYVDVKPDVNNDQAETFVRTLENLISLPSGTLNKIRVQDGNHVSFTVDDNMGLINSSSVAKMALNRADDIKNKTGLLVVSAGIGGNGPTVDVVETAEGYNGPKYFVLTFVLFGVVAGLMLGVVALYLVRRHTASRSKLQQLAGAGVQQEESSKDYQDLCRQRMQSKASERPEPLSAVARVASVTGDGAQVASPSSRSSTSSWSEEPVASNMDISTGHIVLSYMEDHLQNKGRLDAEWEALVAYEAEPSATTVGLQQSNARKIRYPDVLPYDHSRVVLNINANASNSDYINASTITDHDPRNPAYIATQGPLSHTVADFWQMIWEQGSVVIVCLCNHTEDGEVTFQRYWPEEGSDLYHIYEVHLVSEHIWCDDYLVRSFYLKNLQTSETRTVTQFHFLTWPDLGIPAQTKALLDFRRKVNKSYRGRSSPIVVHCNDGVGRTGTYTLIDMVLNRMSKGAKEIDIAATLEHIRDQRMNMAKTKEQFEFALATVAEEVHNILKALPQ
eukprot:GHVU01112242.1.p1 GENE.GHVU01112242.1~~GHVU01112242.1.p1  ORF type:complete len:571 (+),score=52.83 GHVU01112242.1:3-1715(+)